MFSQRRFIAFTIVTMMIVHPLWAQLSESLNGPFKAKDVKDLAVNSNGMTLYAADQTFLFKSTNEGISWAVTGVELASPLVVTCKPDAPDVVVVGVAGHLYWNATGGSAAWQVIPTLENTNLTPLRLSVSPLNTNNMWLGRKFVSGDKSVYKSADGGANWSAINSFIWSTDIYGIFPDPSNAQAVWVGGSSPTGATEGTNPNAPNSDPAAPRGVWMSTNKGINWIDRKMGDFNVRAVGVNGAKVYAGTVTGRFGVSTDGGNTWSLMANPSGSASITAIHVNGSQVYASTSEGIYLTTNDGFLWAGPMGILTMQDKNVLSFSAVSSSPSTFFAGTSSAIYTSTNAGLDWTQADTGVGRMPVQSFTAMNTSFWAAAKGYPLVGYNDGISWSNATIAIPPATFNAEHVMRASDGYVFLTGSLDQKRRCIAIMD